MTNRYMHLAPTGAEEAVSMLERLRTPEIASAPIGRSDDAPRPGATNQETVRRRKTARPKKAA